MAAVSPGAHVQCSAFAALANQLAGNREAANRWAGDVLRKNPRYNRSSFVEAFPFRDEQFREKTQSAFNHLFPRE